MNNESRYKILAVDNEIANQDIIMRHLKHRYDVTVASSGEMALEIVKNEMFDLILMDIDLGSGLTGVEVTQILRMDERYSKTPIIALTAYALPEYKEIFLQAGCIDYLAMPFNKEQLYEIIERNFGGR